MNEKTKEEAKIILNEVVDKNISIINSLPTHIKELIKAFNNV